MSGAFRYFRGILCCLAVAGLSFGGRYAVHWLRQDVDHPGLLASSHSVLLPSVSRSEARRTEADGVVWKVIVVTNRLGVSQAKSVAAEVGTSGLTLKQQVQEMLLSNPTSHFGRCEVILPVGRRLGTCRLAGDDRVRLSDIDWQADASRESLVERGTSDLLIFVHGFNVQLDEAIARAAQLAEDTCFPGRVIAFSWQSRAETMEYRTDEQLAERYFWNLAELVHQIRQSDPDVRLHILAHSMGNRVTLRALTALCGAIDPMGGRDELSFQLAMKSNGQRTWSDSPGVVAVNPRQIRARYPSWGAWHPDRLRVPSIDTLIMAAPDVDQSEFTGFVRTIKHACRRLVLYASDADYALRASAKLHGGAFRAGDSRASVRVDGLTVVNVTGVDATDPLGHSYYGSRPQVLRQLNYLFHVSTKRSAANAIRHN